MQTTVCGQAVLPLSRTTWDVTPPTGWTDNNTSAYITPFACTGLNMGRFDAQGDSYTVFIDSDPGILSFSLKKSSISGNTFVQAEQSDDGITWILLDKFGTASGATLITDCNSIVFPLNPSTRYIRWAYTKATGNCGIDDVTITKACNVPSNQATNISSLTPGFQNLNIQWTNGNGNGRVVYINTSNSFAPPVNGTDPTAISFYSGSGQQVIYNGSGNTANVTGLNPCREYWFRVYEYNCSGSAIMFNTATSAGNPTSISTSSIIPSLLTLASENFEGTASWSYTYSCSNYGTGGGGSCVVGIKPSPFGYPASKALVKSHSVDNASAEIESEATIDFNQIPIPLSATNIRLSFRLASLNAAGNTSISTGAGHDIGDYFSLYLQINSTGLFSETFTQKGSSDKLFGYLPEKLSSLSWNQNAQLLTPNNDYNYFSVSIPDGTNAVNVRLLARNNRTGENWCIDEMLLTADMPSASTLPALFNITGTPVFCAGSNGTLIGLSGSQSGMSYQLFLNGTPVGSPVTGTGNSIDFGYHTGIGIYTVVATNLNYIYCKSDMLNPLSVSLQASPAITSINSSPASCGSLNGSITINASGGTLPYQYSIDNGLTWQSSNIFNNLSAGTYYVMVKDNNCSSTAIPEVITNAGSTLSVVTTTIDVDCIGNSTGSATISPSGGTPGYTFLWNTIPSQNTATATGLSAGSYTCIVTDNAGCDLTETVIINEPLITLSGGIISQTDVDCFGFNTGSASVSGQGGTSGYTYLWNTVPVQSTQTASNLNAGPYICTITDSKGCTTQVNVFISGPATVLSGSISSQTITICPGTATGTALVAANGGSPGYSYVWNTTPPQTSATATNLPAGTSVCTITDSHGCDTNVPVTIAAFQSPSVADAGNAQNICGATTQLNGNTPTVGTGFWTQISGPVSLNFSDPTICCPIITTTASGIFDLEWTITNEITCPASSDQVTIQFSDAVTVTAGNNSPVCTGEDIFLTSDIAGATYAWTSPSGFTSTDQNPVISGSTSANNETYTVTVSGIPGGCPNTSNSTTVIVINAANTAPITSPQPIIGNNQDACTGSQIPYTIEPPTIGSTYNWTLSGGGTFASPNGSNLILINWMSVGGPYVLSVTETTIDGCAGTPVTLNITVNSISTPKVSITSDNNPVCTGTPVTFTADDANGGTSPQFTWFVNDIQMPNPGPSTLTYIPLDGDRVYAVLESSSPCAFPNPVPSEVDTMIVTNTVPPGILISTPATSLCTGDPAIITATPTNGGASPAYEWYINDTLQVGITDSTFTYYPGNGDAVYAKIFSNLGCASPNFAVSPVIVFDISQAFAVLLVIAQQPTLCFSDSSAILASAKNQGPAPVYEWYLNNSLVSGQQTPVFSGIFSNGDIIHAKVKTSLSCATGNPATSNDIVISKPALLEITKVDTVNESCGLANGSIKLTASGGTGPYEFSVLSPPVWVNDPVFDSLSSSIPYALQVKDMNGCIGYKGIYMLTDKPGPVVSASGAGRYCAGDTVVLSAFQQASLSYEWLYPSGNTTTADKLTVLGVVPGDSGLYRLIGIDNVSGCSDTTWLKVSINKIPDVSLGVPPTLCAGTQYILSPGPGYASYLWQDGSIQSSFSAIDPGSYYVKATDTAGCSGTDTAMLIPCSQVYMPNAFSPDRNGTNEHFRPVTGGIALTDFNMIIYNRWGQLIFKSDNYITGWDGTLNGSLVPNGLYVYLITYSVADSNNPGAFAHSELRGTVMVVK